MANQGTSQSRIFRPSKGARDRSKNNRGSIPQHTQNESFHDSSHREYKHFRTMTIYPESEDILCSDESVYLQPNLTNEKYSGVDQYLDIQFRLLREDYIRPLRSSIAEYRQKHLLESQQRAVGLFNANDPPPEIMRASSTRIYEKVKFIKETAEKNTQNSRRKKNNVPDSALVCFASKSEQKLKNMDWEHNQRFMLGSLLCFSSDNFQTLIFATVLERDLRLLEQGKLRINLCKEQQAILFHEEYTMVESEVFFTPYYFVLKTLQKMTEETFPFPEYFLHLEQSDSPPSYLTMARHHDPVRYTLHMNGYHEEISVLERGTWPPAQRLGLHNAQYDALQAALTKELVVIQGPPGTGKTFIGLKIAEILVQNKAAASRTTPILVIALTNHALDQFLVGMLQFTNNIIRIGSQSKSPELSAYNLKGKRSPMQSKEVRTLWSQVKHFETQMESLLSEITNLQSISSRGILDPDILDEAVLSIVPDHFIEDLINGEFMSWLLQKQNRNDVEMRGIRYYMTFEELLTEINKNLDCYMQTFGLTIDNRGKNFNEKSRFLIQKFTSYMDLKLRRTRTSIEEAKKRAFDLQDLEVLRECDVVGMTTTAGARLQEMLRMLNPEIVIIEEAAEVMEAHIIACITNECQHLILIGDHKQLRPKVSSYELEMDYNFNVSLFERMIMTRGKYVRLTEQHRMAPQISQLVTPSIYTTLTNAQKVIDYPEIIGLERRLFFIDHTVLEKTMVKKDREELKGVIVQVVDNYQGEENDIILLSLVRSNPRKEIGFLKSENRVCVALTRAKLGMYIIGNMNCLSTSVIWMTMKCTLERQNALGNGLPLRCRLHTTNVSTVSSCSDFLTKSPFGGCTVKCGFPLPNCSHPCNRTCHPMDNQDHVGYKCQSPCENICPYNHPCKKFCFEDCGNCTEKVPKVRSCSHEYLLECGVDEERIRCVMPCVKKLPCRHTCTKKCCETCEPCEVNLKKTRSCRHSHELKCFEDVEQIKCLMPCARILKCNHPCLRQCWKKCEPCVVPVQKERSCRHSHELKCFEDVEQVKCEVPVQKERSCKHSHQLMCFEDVEQVKCLMPCARTLKCNHPCQRQCWETCEPCEVPVQKERSCKHSYQLMCFEDVEQVKCLMPCARTLKCNHPCQRQCWEKCEPCEVPVQKERSCEHSHQLMCFEDVEQVKCLMPCARTLKCNHPCQRQCWEKCEPCEVPVQKERSCKHSHQLMCFEDVEQVKCLMPCVRTLKCNHPCQCQCWEKCAPCEVPVQKERSCGHIYRTYCSKDLEKHFCSERCAKTLDCSHKCARLCSENCNPCEILVNKERNCGHTVYNVTCCTSQESLEQMLCTNQCTKELDCGHACKKECWEECLPCMKTVWKKATCGHELKVKCFIEVPQSELCNNPCQIELSCGHQCANACNKPCTEVCRVEVEGHRACGHLAQFECWELEKGLLEPLKNPVCSEMCNQTLICGHNCPGTCVACNQGLFHVRCAQNCERSLQCPCKAQCAYVCGMLCPPCRNQFCGCTHQPPCTRIGPNNAPCKKAMNSTLTIKLRRLKKITEDLLNTLTPRSSVASFFVRVFRKETYRFKPFEELACSVTQVRDCLTDSKQIHDVTNVKVMELSVCILSHICNVWHSYCRVNPDETSVNELKSYATSLLYMLRKEKIVTLWLINEQRIADFTLELERLQRMAQYFCLKSLVGSTEGLQPQYVTIIEQLRLLVFSFQQRFTHERNDEAVKLMEKICTLLKIENPIEMQFGNVNISDTPLAK